MKLRDIKLKKVPKPLIFIFCGLCLLTGMLSLIFGRKKKKKK